MTDTRMIVNYTPGEACRVAIEEGGKLNELNAEQMNAVSRVGNIYVGRVHNVEESIQAAFVDFGVGINGFLHVSDVHPRYFPGDEDAKERVGKKTPRRDRPPIQRTFKRGQEIIVQVLKEGVGSKGPTLTSYLSIPGRFLVMMPHMDKVGVSRNVEDEDARRDMRKILDALDLPKEFGFILRTAGFERTKAELKRDLSYLQRLWKDMETRRKKGKKPRLLYSESDLLLRSIRDHLGTDVKEVIIDSELAIKRAARFVKIVAPRSTTRLKRYTGSAPIFHAFGLEQQISAMHAREAPLPSGGRLVIDETEALVAIDVNSGRSRSARDAETNAYNTNMEAADEICRQLRLRDLGGLVINDLIDMREARHRKAVEAKFRELLKKDRAKSTILPISEFGILEMTRQRMRGSHESQHFTPCPTCHGRGLIQKPSSVASDALREVEALLQHNKIDKVELVVSSRVAGELLSARRRAIGRIEKRSGKRVDVRISDAIPMDRFTLYAYDATGSDIDLERLGKVRHDQDVVDWKDAARDGEDWAMDLGLEADGSEREAGEGEDLETELQPFELDADGPMVDLDDDSESDDEEHAGGKKKRRRRRGRRRGRRSEDGDAERSEREDDASASEATADEEEAEASSDDDREASDDESGEGSGGKKKRRRRRGRRRGRRREDEMGESDTDESSADEAVETVAEDGVDEDAEEDDTEFEAPPARPDGRRKKRRGRSLADRFRDDDAASEAPEAESQSESDEANEPSASEDTEDVTEDEAPRKRSSRGRRGGRGRSRSGRSSETEDSAASAHMEAVDDEPKARPARGSKKRVTKKAPAKASASAAAKSDDGPKPVVTTKKVRALYGRGRRKLTPGDRPARGSDD